jgi:hypothetical protein
MRVRGRHGADALGAITTIAVASLCSFPLPAVAEGRVSVDAGDPFAALERPHVLRDEDIAGAIVRVRGSSMCSGTPITGTPFVITAAHCVLDGEGDVTAVTVVREGVEHTPQAVLVNPRYHDEPGPQLDAAVLIMERAIPGSAATLGDTLPTQGRVTLAGLQPIDTDGTLLRGTSYDDRPTPQGATGWLIEIESLPSGCMAPVSSIEVGANHLTVGCGLVPGASGGGLFVEQDGRVTLLGIISTVAHDLSSNGVTPPGAVHELLDHPAEYMHALPHGPDVALPPTPRS